MRKLMYFVSLVVYLLAGEVFGASPIQLNVGIYVRSVSMNNKEQQATIDLYYWYRFPNPSKGMVEITAKEIMRSIKVLDANGKKVIETFPLSKKTSLMLSFLPPGNYTFEVIMKSGLYRKSLVFTP
ncbi:MAG: T9SS type A sorting domain-containing protein [Bacteroidetes bacterium]|nr:T9SS type A sorting domain-containing protein [Bacteroidota bacterium]